MIQNPFFPEIHGNFGFGCMRLPMKDGKVNYDEFCRITTTSSPAKVTAKRLRVSAAASVKRSVRSICPSGSC